MSELLSKVWERPKPTFYYSKMEVSELNKKAMWELPLSNSDFTTIYFSDEEFQDSLFNFYRKELPIVFLLGNSFIRIGNDSGFFNNYRFFHVVSGDSHVFSKIDQNDETGKSARLRLEEYETKKLMDYFKIFNIQESQWI